MAASRPAATAVAPHLDAQLLRLGAALHDAWAREAAAWAVVEEDDDIQDSDPRMVRACRLADATGDVVAKIERQRARTLDGLLVKIRALDWNRMGGPLTIDDFVPYGHVPSADAKVVVSLITDLWLMGRS